MKLANQHTIALLDKAERNLTLMIDASALTAGYTTADNLRTTQQYRDHPKLEAIVVIANNKLNRLITLLAYCTARARFVQFNSREEAQTFMGIVPGSDKPVDPIPPSGIVTPNTAPPPPV
jgi:hypothetical protein